jgi:hypothetical protein
MKKLLTTTVLLLLTLSVNAQLKELHTPKYVTISRVSDLSVWKGSLIEKDKKHYYISFRNPKYQYITDAREIHIGSKSNVQELRQTLLNIIGTKDDRTFETKYHTIYVEPFGKKYVRIGIYQEYADNLYTGYFSKRRIKKLLPEILN